MSARCTCDPAPMSRGGAVEAAATLRRAARQIRNDCGGAVSRNTRDGRRWLPVADVLDEAAAACDAHVASIWISCAQDVARAYLFGEPEEPCRCIAAGCGGVHYPSDHANVIRSTAGGCADHSEAKP